MYKLTNEGLESINGKSCIFDITHNYTNGEQLSGQTLPSGSIKQVRCDSGYSGDIRLKCNNGTIESIGNNGACTFAGCKKYDNDNNNTLNNNYKDTLENDIDIYLTNTDIETLKEQNKDTEYNKGDIVDTISCNTSESTYVTNNGGWTIKCNGNNKFIVEGNGCTFKSGSKEFNYTGGIQSFAIPKAFGNKDITLELWGGQGGNTSIASGGKGGYTKLVSQLGNKFNEGTVLYLVIGGKGVAGSGGYNGGGSGYGYGAGATHIATKSGLLSSLSGSKSSVLAVAGGGGSHDSYGGGANMGGGSDHAGGKGGTLTSGGTGYNSGTFGKGGNGNKNSGYGGGGGYYGGGGSSSWSGSGGGSGYCNTSLGSCSGSNGVRKGNGYAKISW